MFKLSLKIWPTVILTESKFFEKKVRLQDFGSRRIKQFPIDCTSLLITIIQKNIYFFFKSLTRDTKFFPVFFLMKIKEFGSRQIKQFPIDCTPCLKTIFDARHNACLSFFETKCKHKILDPGESNNFLSIAPHLFC